MLPSDPSDQLELAHRISNLAFSAKVRPPSCETQMPSTLEPAQACSMLPTSGVSVWAVNRCGHTHAAEEPSVPACSRFLENPH